MKTASAYFAILCLATISTLLPPCQGSEFVVGPLRQPGFERSGVGGFVWRRQDYKDYVTKGMQKPTFIERELMLSEAEVIRAEKLLSSDAVRRVLLTGPQKGSMLSVEKSSRRAVIAGPAETVVVIQTMIQNELTFLYATGSADRSGNVLDVLSLVAPDFLEANPQLASHIAQDNYEGVNRILKPEAGDYRRAGKRVWFNPSIGTVTILDQPDRIEQVRRYLAMRPYAPRPTTY